jgi:hypothetical protein
VRLLAAATVLVTALLIGAAIAPAADIGANDDSAKYEPDGGAALYAQMSSLGLRQIVIGVRFVPSEPLVIQDKAELDRAIPTAIGAGLKVILAIYPYPPRELEAGLGSPSLFAAYVGTVASVYPEVKEFVIGNEPNQPAFWRPQFDARGANVSAAAFGPYLAAAYDALKSVDSAITVVGVGLSPRGNDQPDAESNISTSPLRFLRALGDWYRRSGRTRPLMDAFSFHPYPNRATDPLDRGYAWPNAGFVDLDRVKQGLWDAFHGTPQPTTLDGLKLHLDEVGWQVDTSGRPGYTGVENVPVTTELEQAAIYGDLVRRAACDPDVAEVSFFGFRDDGARTGFQAALERVDGSLRPSAAAVEAAISDGGSRCRALVAWRPEQDVVGAEVAVRPTGGESLATLVGAGEDARTTVCARVAPVTSHAGTADPQRLTGESVCRRATVRGLHAVVVQLRLPSAVPKRVEVAVELVAESNRLRRTVVVKDAALR